MPGRRAIFVTTEDRFFVSHRRPIAQALAERGFEIVVAARDTGVDTGFRFHALPLDRGSVSPSTEAKTIAALSHLYLRERPSVVHHSTIKANVYGSIAARLANVPAIVNTVTGLGFALTQRPNDSLKQRALRAVALRLYGAALRTPRSHTIFQNPEQQRTFVGSGLVRQDDTTLVLGAGVDTNKFKPTPLPSEPLVVLPARMLWDKGVGEMVQAARQLGVRVALVGGEDPDNGAAISRATLDAWAKEGIVEWWGHRKDMPQVYAQASLVVLPSYAEGLPLALAEAQASGRACVTTDAPGCRDAIVAGVTGMLVPVRSVDPLAQTIAALLADRAKLQRMGDAARQHAVATLSQDRVVRETLAVFAKLGVT